MVDGDEVITAVAGFPTTVNPILQNRLLPVFVDVELETYDATVEAVEAAITPKTKAIFMVHTLGNPFDVVKMRELADAYGTRGEADRLAGELHGRLRYARIDRVFEIGLHTFLRGVRDDISTLSDEIGRQFLLD